KEEIPKPSMPWCVPRAESKRRELAKIDYVKDSDQKVDERRLDDNFRRDRQNTADQKVLDVLGAFRCVADRHYCCSRTHGIGDANDRFLRNLALDVPRKRKDEGS